MIVPLRSRLLTTTAPVGVLVPIGVVFDDGSVDVSVPREPGRPSEVGSVSIESSFRTFSMQNNVDG